MHHTARFASLVHLLLLFGMSLSYMRPEDTFLNSTTAQFGSVTVNEEDVFDSVLAALQAGLDYFGRTVRRVNLDGIIGCRMVEDWSRTRQLALCFPCELFAKDNASDWTCYCRRKHVIHNCDDERHVMKFSAYLIKTTVYDMHDEHACESHLWKAISDSKPCQYVGSTCFSFKLKKQPNK